jgi:hypothetical protein
MRLYLEFYKICFEVLRAKDSFDEGQDDTPLVI